MVNEEAGILMGKGGYYGGSSVEGYGANSFIRASSFGKRLIGTLFRRRKRGKPAIETRKKNDLTEIKLKPLANEKKATVAAKRFNAILRDYKLTKADPNPHRDQLEMARKQYNQAVNSLEVTLQTKPKPKWKKKKKTSPAKRRGRT